MKIVPNRVSTGVDARFGFNRGRSIEKAHSLLRRSERAGFLRERIVIKLASNSEGIKVSEQLVEERVNCNLILMFFFAQAAACAEAGVKLISPFVGRRLDQHKKAAGRDSYPPTEDPDVISATNIYNYRKRFGYETQLENVSYDEPSFRWELNQDQMATEKLSDGFRVFATDSR